MQDVIANISGFDTWSHVEKIKFFAWHLHSQKGKEVFNGAYIRQCYEHLGLTPPANITSQLKALELKKPKQILRQGAGYRLEKRVYDAFETKYGTRPTSKQIHQLLANLPSQIPSLDERSFLSEAITCLKADASRAAIVMCWSLAFDHLLNYVTQSQLALFNSRWPVQFPKEYAKCVIKTVIKREDFENIDLKESQIISICKSAGIIPDNMAKVLSEKLGRRNLAAHPNSLIFTTLNAEDFINDLVNNVVLVLK